MFANGVRYGAAACFVTLAMGVTACGNSDSDSSADSGLSGKPVVIGVMMTTVGPAAAPGAAKGVEAVEDYINVELGGIDGRPVKLDVCEGDGTPEKGVECANGFVTDNVSAVFDAADYGAEAALPILEEAAIPMVGTSPGSATVTAAPYGSYFSLSGPQSISALSLLTFLKDSGEDTATLAISDVPTAHDYFDKLLKPVGKSLGIDVSAVYVDAGSSNFPLLIQTTLANDPGVSGVVYLPEAQCNGFLGALYGTGYDGKVWAGGCGSFVDEAGSKAKGAVLQPRLWLMSTQQNAPKDIQSDQAAFAKAMKSAGHEDSVEDNQALYAFAGIVDLVRVIQDVQGDITSASVTAALKKVKDLPGFAGGTYTCDGKQWPGQPGACTSQALFLEVQDDGTLGPVNEEGFVPLDTSILGG